MPNDTPFEPGHATTATTSLADSPAIADGRSLTQRAYEAIKHDIITLRLRPGETLNEAQLMQSTGLGRTPVHQAMHRLALEGLLVILPRKGAMVAPVSLNDALEIIDVRMINETYCVELAARAATPDDLATIEAVLARSREAIAMRDVAATMCIDRDFHLAISRASRNQTLAELLRGLHERSLRFWFLALSTPSHLEGVYEEHLELFEALAAHDAERARRAITRHIEEFRTHILKAI
ncbi:MULTISPECIES: GntR family transcriptional regulator [Pandoraea]|uniref:GntR family transcriptional regulator n=1 Tax=Pandoraea communis TaxID=2508297 RepID=A0A5E4XGK2_9BURK|nr:MULTISPECIES: GntR family transcriptional regulator [Pandoraea]EON13616.1 GntR family transcriptional regulator [Pandoraea sp. SD6-2]VVE35260.1 GntR family transcriptional regulator [Pandoraea communis]